MTRARGRPRSEERRDAVLKAAMELMREDGLRRASVDRISARSGVSKATIYKWCRCGPTRSDLPHRTPWACWPAIPRMASSRVTLMRSRTTECVPAAAYPRVCLIRTAAAALTASAPCPLRTWSR